MYYLGNTVGVNHAKFKLKRKPDAAALQRRFTAAFPWHDPCTDIRAPHSAAFSRVVDTFT